MYCIMVRDENKDFIKDIELKIEELGIGKTGVEVFEVGAGVPFIIGNCRYRSVKLFPYDILYIENVKHGSRIHLCPDVKLKDMDEDVLLSDLKIRSFYEQFKDYGFAYAHNSYIVNLNYVREVTYKELVFLKWNDEDKDIVLSVARSKWKELRERFRNGG